MGRCGRIVTRPLFSSYTLDVVSLTGPFFRPRHICDHHNVLPLSNTIYDGLRIETLLRAASEGMYNMNTNNLEGWFVVRDICKAPVHFINAYTGQAFYEEAVSGRG